jgi:hypothetical protein
MMRMRNNHNHSNKTNGVSSPISSGGCRTAEPGSMEWEMRPGGMLVQTRTTASDRNPVLVPTIRVRVKFRSIYHEVNISSQASFGNSFHNFFLLFL